ncbi:protein phosphatase [Pararhodobacter marinus]|uniref:Protein phosphatase n=1 Tax=Pararhodobacter marinus TaxID=2184063 RepID=A0A2U2CGG2_9RHOB|nr:protein-tyrosine phosphatase family protein [Pararhodobacter marinus]PWE30976.1 protein phosphatase [Pararhodobacter marinus]
MTFSISSLALRGGTLALCPLPVTPVERAAVAAFAPDLVVSMTRLDEMTALEAGDLPDWLRGQGIGWRHFPVADYDVPPDDADWTGLAQAVFAVLDRAGTVIVHCRGGLGRSGMLALRLMIDSGEEPDAALTRLRAARPGAVETDAQVAWARRGLSPA